MRPLWLCLACKAHLGKVTDRAELIAFATVKQAERQAPNEWMITCQCGAVKLFTGMGLIWSDHNVMTIRASIAS